MDKYICIWDNSQCCLFLLIRGSFGYKFEARLYWQYVLQTHKFVPCKVKSARNGHGVSTWYTGTQLTEFENFTSAIMKNHTKSKNVPSRSWAIKSKVVDYLIFNAIWCKLTCSLQSLKTMTLNPTSW